METVFWYYKCIVDHTVSRNCVSDFYSRTESYEDVTERIHRFSVLTKAFLGDEQAKNTIREAVCQDIDEGLSLADYYTRDKNGNPFEPYASQKKAIIKAMNYPITVIKGPPGTGKTMTILQLISCICGSNDDTKSIVICSGTNAAVQNIIEEIDREVDGDDNRLCLKHHFLKLGRRYDREKAYKLVREQLDETDSEEESRNPVSYQQALDAGYRIFSTSIHSLEKSFTNGREIMYDYVIIDESSLVRPEIGLIAMSHARHLVVVGDTDQLPPVFTEQDDEFIRDSLPDILQREGIQSIPEEYRIDKDASIMSVLYKVFPEQLYSKIYIMLDEHYRCHYDIINFCNKYIYEGKLQIKTAICEPRMPIRVRWFEGDYCEQFFIKDRISKWNRRQIDVFMREEWSEGAEYSLYRRLKEQPELSVLILSPYKGQLLELSDRINQYCNEQQENITADYNEVKENTPDDNVHVPTLTIHKSQGREYDIVYLLPVEDGDWEWPWSQEKYLINVAVSRAKRELVVITSSVLMDRNMQIALTGYYIPPRSNPQSLPKSMNGIQANSPEGEYSDADHRYLQKLLQYVYAFYKQHSQQDYGLHKADTNELFDQRVLAEKARRIMARLWPEQESAEHWEGEMQYEIDRFIASSPEVYLLHKMCLWQEMQSGDYMIYRDVRLKDIVNADGRRILEHTELTEGETSRELDFVITRRNPEYQSEILMAIELDGSVHRVRAECENRDQRKQEIIKDYFPELIYIRLAENGGHHIEDETDIYRYSSDEQALYQLFQSCLKKGKDDNKEHPEHYYLNLRSISAYLRYVKSSDGGNHQLQGNAQTANRALIDSEKIKKYYDTTLFLQYLLMDEDRKKAFYEADYEDISWLKLEDEKIGKKLIQCVESYKPFRNGKNLGITIGYAMARDYTFFSALYYSIDAEYKDALLDILSSQSDLN